MQTRSGGADGESAEYDPAQHYDRVTEAWRFLLGEELHFGVFVEDGQSLPEATRELTRHMVRAAGPALQPGARVLDVGCGTGGPARHLATDHGVDVLGITTSEVGLDTAVELSAELGVDSVSFEQRDGMDNGLPDQSFDIVWALESSHLMRDRPALLAECARVLRPGGRFVLCDLLRWREIGFDEVRGRLEDFVTLRSAFGDAHFESLDFYTDACVENGLDVVVREDLTEATLPTFERWRRNAEQHEAEVVELIGRDGLADFVRSCDILEGLWQDGTFGYGLVAATRAR